MKHNVFLLLRLPPGSPWVFYLCGFRFAYYPNALGPSPKKHLAAGFAGGLFECHRSVQLCEAPGSTSVLEVFLP